MEGEALDSFQLHLYLGQGDFILAISESRLLWDAPELGFWNACDIIDLMCSQPTLG